MATKSKAAFLEYDRTLGVAAMESRGFYYPVDAAISPEGRIYGLSRSHEGTGLGLPLTKSLVELHDGTLELESELGAGTTATVKLPAARLGEQLLVAQ